MKRYLVLSDSRTKYIQGEVSAATIQIRLQLADTFKAQRPQD